MPNPAKQIVLGRLSWSASPRLQTQTRCLAPGINRQARLPLYRAAPANCRTIRSGPIPRPMQPQRATGRRCRALSRCALLFAPLHERHGPGGRSKRQSEDRALSSATRLCERHCDASLHERCRREGRSKPHAEVRALSGDSGLRCGCLNAPVYERRRGGARRGPESSGRPAGCQTAKR
jgi:hypothetical protein